MNIDFYDIVLDGLKKYNAENVSKKYKNTIVSIPPTKPTYPLTVFEEIDNSSATRNKLLDVTANVGFKVSIFAQNKGETPKNIVAREIAKTLDTYLSNCVGLKRLSFNVFTAKESSLYEVVMIYTGTLNEYRLKVN